MPTILTQREISAEHLPLMMWLRTLGFSKEKQSPSRENTNGLPLTYAFPGEEAAAVVACSLFRHLYSL